MNATRNGPSRNTMAGGGGDLSASLTVSRNSAVERLAIQPHEMARVRTIARVPCDLVIVGTPIDPSRLVIDKPVVRARYEPRGRCRGNPCRPTIA
jgi:hypothetical protein